MLHEARILCYLPDKAAKAHVTEANIYKAYNNEATRPHDVQMHCTDALSIVQREARTLVQFHLVDASMAPAIARLPLPLPLPPLPTTRTKSVRHKCTGGRDMHGVTGQAREGMVAHLRRESSFMSCSGQGGRRIERRNRQSRPAPAPSILIFRKTKRIQSTRKHTGNTQMPKIWLAEEQARKSTHGRFDQ